MPSGNMEGFTFSQCVGPQLWCSLTAPTQEKGDAGDKPKHSWKRNMEITCEAAKVAQDSISEGMPTQAQAKMKYTSQRKESRARWSIQCSKQSASGFELSNALRVLSWLCLLEHFELVGHHSMSWIPDYKTINNIYLAL